MVRVLPQQTTVIIVGAGPSGLACAISLIGQGYQDLIIVDAVAQGDNTSRAAVIHAATLEALDTIGCAEPLVQRGIKASGMTLHNGSSPIISIDFNGLAPYTPFPYSLLIPQDVTEFVLEEKLSSMGVSVFRPCRVIGIKKNENDSAILDITFESGETVRASYIIGADGARSTVRNLSGITFEDPDDTTKNAGHSALAQMVLADVVFNNATVPPLPTDRVLGFVSAGALFGLIPLPAPVGQAAHCSPSNIMFRMICSVPESHGVPPSSPPTDFLQSLILAYGPTFLSSDPAVNPHPVEISRTIWSTRFRNHAAIADKFFTRFEDTAGIVFLIGDSAHIHSPAGGQGMNLGLRDAIGLGPLIAARIETPSSGDPDKSLREYAATRHARALSVIALTKGLLGSSNLATTPGIGRSVAMWFVKVMGQLVTMIPMIKVSILWKLSGLGAR